MEAFPYFWDKIDEEETIAHLGDIRRVPISFLVECFCVMQVKGTFLESKLTFDFVTRTIPTIDSFC